MNDSVERLSRAREHPNRTPVMYQRWDDLLFLHWIFREEDLKHHLPKDLSLDLLDGNAYLSIVAFRMNAVRPTGLPALPWLSYFYELNVRVYVRDPSGEPGVYFLSLDCNRAPAVWIAQSAFNLPYKHAVMHFATSNVPGDGGKPVHSITCARLGQSDAASYRWTAPRAPKPAQPGSVEFFLTERYNFFTMRCGTLMRGQVHHAPYEVGSTEVTSWSELPVAWNGLSVTNRPPDLVSASPGVVVQAFALVPAKQR